MRYLALATDYDGTLAQDGRVDDQMIAALRRWRASGRLLVLVTGRELGHLLAVFPYADLFEWVVAENGALLYQPASKQSRVLSAAPPPELIDELRRKGVPLSVGCSILATLERHEHIVRAAIRDLGLEWHVIFNKGSVMALPSGVTKATGLAAALADLKLPAERVVGVGDAENDHAFLRLCGMAVAVANALPALKATADLVTESNAGAGVAELVDKLLADGLEGLCPETRNPNVEIRNNLEVRNPKQ